MTMPGSDDSTAAQILVKLGEMGAQLAVIGEQLKSIPDHEQRLRALESINAANRGSRDMAARWWAVAAVLAAGGSGTAAWVAILTHR